MKSFLVVLTSVLLLCVPISILAEESEQNQEALKECLASSAYSWSQCYKDHGKNKTSSELSQFFENDNDNLQKLLTEEMQNRPLIFTFLPWTPTPAEIVRDYFIN